MRPWPFHLADARAAHVGILADARRIGCGGDGGVGHRSVSIPLETTRTILSVAPTGEGPGRIHWSNGLEARDRPGPRSPSRPMAGRWCSARSGAAVSNYARRDGPTERDTNLGHERRQQSVFVVGRSVGWLYRKRRAQEGSSQRRTGGHAVQGGVALRGELGRRRHHCVRGTTKRGPVACVGRGRHSRIAHDPSARRVQSPAAPCCPAAAP